jgi:hypothetical protein
MEDSPIATYLTSINFPPESAIKYSQKLNAQEVYSVDDLLSLQDSDLRNPEIGMALGEISKIRPYLRSSSQPQPSQPVMPTPQPTSTFYQSSLPSIPPSKFQQKACSHLNWLPLINEIYLQILLEALISASSKICKYISFYQR